MEGWIKLDREILESKVFANPNDLKIWVWLMLKASTTDRYLTLKTGKGCQTIEIKRGQMVFGRHKAEQDLKIDGSTVYRTLQRFQDEQRIIIKANNQFSIITVNDFINSQSFTEVEDFEILEDEQPTTPEVSRQRSTNEQPMNNQRTGNEQPTNTVLEGLKGKEFKEGLESQKGKEGISPAPVSNLFGEPEKPKNGKHKKATQEAGAKKIPHLFRDSDYFQKSELIQDRLNGTPYESAAVEYYHESALNWSDSKGEKKLDWLATLKNWMARDATKNQFITKDFIKNNQINGNGKQGIKGTDYGQNGNASGGIDALKARIVAANDKYGR